MVVVLTDFGQKPPLRMANAMCSKINSLQNSFILKSTFTFITTLSTSSDTTKKSKRRKKKNFFQVAQFLPNWGIGYHMAKTHWKEVSYQITKLNLYKDGKHGKAWGIAHKNGLPIVDAPKKISGVHKRCWRYLPGIVKASESSPTLTSSTDSDLKVEPQAS